MKGWQAPVKARTEKANKGESRNKSEMKQQSDEESNASKAVAMQINVNK
jgi:hypothetical protein